MTTAAWRTACAFLGMALLAACGAPSGPSGEWPVHGGTDLEQRFAKLDEVNAGNVDKLGLAWSFELGSNRGQEATPIVVDGVMYVSAAWSLVYALDAETGRELWHFDPKIAGRKGFDACCDVVNRGVAVSDGRVFLGALDGRLIALDAKTGKELWSTQTTDPGKPYTITGAPRVAGDKVIIGNGGAEYGVRGYVGAYSVKTGKLVWRFYTVPGDPAAGPDGAASDDILKTAALPTWAGRWHEYGGGGTVWDAIVYDPELKQLYIGVGNGSPWNHNVRSDGKGDNLFLSSIVALDPDTGAYKWHYQETPGESWDFTATQPIILATLNIEGRDRKVLMQAPKNGFFYVLDRTDGKLISANNFVPMNWATGIDMKTGRPVENPAARYTDKPFLMYPNALGAHSWHPMAFSPATGLVYIPVYHSLFLYGQDPNFSFVPGLWNNAIDNRNLQAPDDPEVARRAGEGFEGRLVAWNPVTQREVWSVAHPTLQNGGVLATAGNLVFQGTGTGRFEARNATDGKLLWSFSAQDGIIAGPVSYQAGGTQHIAVVAGYGGGFGLGEGAEKPKVRPNGRVLVFKLGGTAQLPVYEPGEAGGLVISAESFTAAQIDSGRLLYTQQCYRCHGAGAASAGVLPDLRRSGTIASPDAWRAVVLDGALEERGMISFKTWLKEDEVEDIRAYVAHRAKIAKQQAAQQQAAQQQAGHATGKEGKGALQNAK